MLLRIFYSSLIIILPLLATGQFRYPANVQAALDQTNNKVELGKGVTIFL
jgi:hypothetical protein